MREERSRLFSAEHSRQMASIPRLEKIEVEYKGAPSPKDAKLLLNKGISTPHDVAKREDIFIAVFKTRFTTEKSFQIWPSS